MRSMRLRWSETGESGSVWRVVYKAPEAVASGALLHFWIGLSGGVIAGTPERRKKG